MDEEEQVKRLIAAYREELRANPPIRSLQEGERGRESLAWAFAKKDVLRAVAAMKRAGLTLAEAT